MNVEVADLLLQLAIYTQILSATDPSFRLIIAAWLIFLKKAIYGPNTRYESVERMEKDAKKMQCELGKAVALHLIQGFDPLPRQFLPEYKIDAVVMMKMEAEARLHLGTKRETYPWNSLKL